MQKLGPQDAMMVYAEAAGWSMQIGFLAVYEPETSTGRLTLSRLRDFFDARLPQIPIYRQRLVTVPGDLGRPVWVEEAAVDLTRRIEEIALPAPGGREELSTLVAELIAIPLDMTEPLWKVRLITGLEDDEVAVLTVVHHAISDGIRHQEVSDLLFDTDPDAPLRRGGTLAGAGTDRPGRGRLLVGAAVDLAATPVRLVRAGVDIVGAVTRSRADGDKEVQEGQEGQDDQGKLNAPWVRFNGQVGTQRIFGYCSLPLAPLKAWGRANGGTVNDVVLTLTGGALRRYLQGRDELPAEPLLANIPVGHATSPEAEKVSNSFSVMIASLATDVDDPGKRMKKIIQSTRAAKRLQGALGDNLLSDVINGVPAPVFALFTKAYSRLGLSRYQHHSANVVVSNLRGPATPFYLAGAKMLAQYPVGPIADGLGLNITLMSYLDSINVGITCSPDLVDDLEGLVSALRTEATQLIS